MLVSIIMPYFRKKKYIKDSVLSVLNQSYKNFELIIIFDDTDQYDLSFIYEIEKLDNRIKILVNKTNLGAGFSRNVGINYSKGFFLAFLDSDDTWDKDKLLLQVNFMQKNNYMITHTSYQIIDENDQIIGSRIAKTMNYSKLIRSCDVGLSSVVLRKELLGENIRFPNLKTKEDFVLWLNITRNGECINALNNNLLRWRRNANSLSSSTLRKLIDGYYVYRLQNFGLIKSLYSLFVLSINFLRKN